MECPRCGSNRLQKKGTRAGKQRYRCTTCFANFCWGVKYVSAPKLEKLNKTCLYCGSTHISRDGKLPSGAQRYKCLDCNRGFSDSTVIKEPEPDKFCPYCGSKLRKAGYSKLGYREYFCKSCNKSCTENAEGIPQRRDTFKDINKDIKCPSCNSSDLRLAGQRDGRRKFSCKSCGRQFIEGSSIRRHSKSEILKIVLEIFDGKSFEEVAQRYNSSVKNLKNIMKRYYSKEHISSEKQNLIKYYGYIMKVPIDYLAPYIHCSYKACENTLKECEEKRCDIQNQKILLQKKVENYLKKY